MTASHGQHYTNKIRGEITEHKALANEDTLLPTQMFPRLPARAIFVADTNFVSGTQKNVSDFVEKHFVSATNVSHFAQSKKHHGQQCVRNNMSSFTRALTVCTATLTVIKVKDYSVVEGKPSLLFNLKFLSAIFQSRHTDIFSRNIFEIYLRAMFWIEDGKIVEHNV